MKRCLFWILAIGLMAATNALAAANSLEIGPACEYLDYYDYTDFGLGADYHYVFPFENTEQGWLPGITLSYRHKQADSFYARISGELFQGHTKYEGTSTGGLPLSENTRNFMSRLEARFGYTYGLHPGITLTPFVGLGLSSWKRELQTLNSYQESVLVYKNTLTSYEERYDWNYILAGLMTEAQLTPNISVGLQAAVRYLFNAEIQPNGSYIYINHFELEPQYGYTAQAPITFTVTPQWQVRLIPRYAYTEIGKSDDYYQKLYFDPADYASSGNVIYYRYTLHYRPSSSMHQAGIAVRLAYTF